MKPFYQDKKESRFYPFRTLDYAPHLHNALEIGWLEEGTSTLLIEGKGYPLHPGDLFAVFPHLIHGFQNSLDARGYLAILTWEDLAPFHTALTGQLPKVPVLRAGSWEHTGLEALIPMAAHDSPTCSKEVKKGYCRILAGKLLPLLPTAPRDDHSKSTLHEVLDYLSTHAGEHLDRKTISRALGVSESTLSHVFSETFHTSLPAFLNRLRLEEAVRLLEESELTVTQIASLSGFGSLRSFNRAFRQSYGVSPTDHRRRNPRLRS